MNIQRWWDELVAQLSDPQPNRDMVIACLEKLLEAAAHGEPLPHACESAPRQPSQVALPEAVPPGHP